jgi:uncharacterized protein YkwD
MFRQTAFGIALSTLVLASGLPTSLFAGYSSKQTATQNKSVSIPLRQVKSFSTFKTTDLEKSVFDQINRYRVSKGLRKLTLNPRIIRQARIHSQNMARHKAPFSHQGFKRRVDAIPLRYRSASENLAFNQGYSDPVKEAVTSWLKSPAHLKNIQGHYNLTGIGVATNSDGEVYLTQIFVRQ